MSNPNVAAFFKGQLDALTLVCENLSNGAPPEDMADLLHRGPDKDSTEKPADWAYQGGYHGIMAVAAMLTALSEKKSS